MWQKAPIYIGEGVQRSKGREGNPHNLGGWTSSLICCILRLSQEGGQPHGPAPMPIMMMERKGAPEDLLGWGGCCLKGVWDSSWDAREKHWGEIMRHGCLVPATETGAGLCANVIANEYPGDPGAATGWTKLSKPGYFRGANTCVCFPLTDLHPGLPERGTGWGCWCWLWWSAECLVCVVGCVYVHVL